MQNQESNIYNQLLFNYCRIGSVFRAVILVQTVTATGLLYAHSNFYDWLTHFAMSNSAVMPATLLWLLIGCICKDLLAKIPRSVQFLFGVSIGGGMGVVAGAIPFSLELSENRLHFAGALTGAGLSALLLMFASLSSNALKRIQTEAQLKILQARVQPHFLFNSLNSAIALVRSEPQKAQALLEDLSDLFRNALRSHDAPITLEGELELTRQYLAIESLRFGKRLQIQWDIDESSKTALVPTLLLQPLAENTIHHAVEKTNETIILKISALRIGRMIHIKVANNYNPKNNKNNSSILNTSPQSRSSTGFGIGLASVEQKLKLFFDIEAYFNVDHKNNVFVIEMRFPILNL